MLSVFRGGGGGCLQLKVVSAAWPGWRAHAQAQLTAAAAARRSDDQMIMADCGSSGEVAVIGNTDITSTESENNIINTVDLIVLFKK